jgi:hypothetical protein
VRVTAYEHHSVGLKEHHEAKSTFKIGSDPVLCKKTLLPFCMRKRRILVEKIKLEMFTVVLIIKGVYGH